MVNGVTFTITENGRVPALSENIQAEEGQEFILFDVEINNTSGEDYRFSQNDYSVVLSSGEIKDNYLLIDVNNNYDDLGSGELAAGGTKKGWVAFKIPKDDQLLEFRYSKKSLSKSEEFRLRLN